MRTLEDSACRIRSARPGGSRSARLAKILAGAVLLLSALTGTAQAQYIDPPTTVGDDVFESRTRKPRSGVNPYKKAAQEYRGMLLGDVIFFPRLFVGATYDDNITWSARNRTDGFGVKINPGLVALRDTGIHKTLLYADADARLLPGLSEGNAVSLRAGVQQVWEVTRDLIIKARVQYDRRENYVEGGTAELTTGSVSSLTMPLKSNQFLASLSARYTFGNAFLGASIETVKTAYEALHTASGRVSQSYRDSLVNTVTVRAGYWLTPGFYAFSEASANVRDYSDSDYRSNGYRMTAGLGTDHGGLVRGEVYAGVQQQFYNQPLIQDSFSPVLGARLFWYPTRDITVRASLDQSFTDSSTPSPQNPNGYPARKTSAELHLNYRFSRDWAFAWRAGYDYRAYLGVQRRDHSWRTGITLSYEIFRNVALTMDYDYSRTISSTPGIGNVRNAVMFGMNYRF